MTRCSVCVFLITLLLYAYLFLFSFFTVGIQSNIKSCVCHCSPKWGGGRPLISLSTYLKSKKLYLIYTSTVSTSTISTSTNSIAIGIKLVLVGDPLYCYVVKIVLVKIGYVVLTSTNFA